MADEKQFPDKFRPRTDDPLTRFIGGSPIGVIFRLVLLSVIVGVILEALGLDPWNILDSLRILFRRVWDMGFEAVHWLGRYFLLGAAIVLPIWFIMRLMHAPRGR